MKKKKAKKSVDPLQPSLFAGHYVEASEITPDDVHIPLSKHEDEKRVKVKMRPSVKKKSMSITDTRLGIICIASNSSTPDKQAFEEWVGRTWCEQEHIEVVGIWREKLVDGEPSIGYWMRYEALRQSLKSQNDEVFSVVGCQLKHPDLGPSAMVMATWKGFFPGLEYLSSTHQTTPKTGR